MCFFLNISQNTGVRRRFSVPEPQSLLQKIIFCAGITYLYRMPATFAVNTSAGALILLLIYFPEPVRSTIEQLGEFNKPVN